MGPAELSVSESLILFPTIESFEATQIKSGLEFHGSIGTDDIRDIILI